MERSILDGLERSINGVSIMKRSVLCVCLGLGVIGSAHAAPNGKTTNNPGASQLLIGSFPPMPGVYAQLTYNNVTADKQYDSQGDRNRNIDQDFEANIANLRLLGILDAHILGADIAATEIIASYVNIDNQLNIGGREINTKVKGLNDIVLTPLILQWNLGEREQWKLTGALGAVVPVGSYSKNKTNNAGGHYFSLMPRGAINYSFKNNIEVGIAPIFNLNSKNTDSGMRTGDELTLDFMANYRKDRLRVGLAGYYYTQLNEDELHGVKIDDSKTKAFGIGPAIQYRLGQHGPNLNVTWQKEVYSVNKSQTDTLRVGIAFKIP